MSSRRDIEARLNRLEGRVISRRSLRPLGGPRSALLVYDRDVDPVEIYRDREAQGLGEGDTCMVLIIPRPPD